MDRRTPVSGDIVIIDSPSKNAIAYVTSTETDEYNQVICKAVTILGLDYDNGTVNNSDSTFEFYDSNYVSIVGVNNCKIPSMFYGVDVKDFMEQAGFEFYDSE